MTTASHYGEGGAQGGPKFSGMHPEGSTEGLGQELHHGQDRRGFRPQQGYSGQTQQGLPQGNFGYQQQGPYEHDSGVYNGHQQHMGPSQYAQGGGVQQMNGGIGGQGAVVDDRDMMTRWLDKVERKFGGERFNNPANAEKNRKLNANMLKRAKQVGMLVIKKAPGMLMKMGR